MDEVTPTIEEMEAKLADRPDLIDRLHKGDTSALAEIMELLTGCSAVHVSSDRDER